MTAGQFESFGTLDGRTITGDELLVAVWRDGLRLMFVVFLRLQEASNSKCFGDWRRCQAPGKRVTTRSSVKVADLVTAKFLPAVPGSFGLRCHATRGAVPRSTAAG